MQTTNQQIGRRILAGLADGLTIQAAFDAVMGAGAYEKLAAELYESLNEPEELPCLARP